MTLRRLAHKLWHYPLSTWPAIDLAGDRDAYAMQGRCDNCAANVAIRQAVGEPIPRFVGRSRLECPRCGVEGVYGLFDMDERACALDDTQANQEQGR